MSLCILPVPLYVAATQGSLLLLLLADVTMGVALSTLVVGAFLAERLPVSVRATGIALSAGWATALVGGTAPLLGSLLSRAGADLGIPLVPVCLSLAALLVLVRPGTSDVRTGPPPQL